MLSSLAGEVLEELEDSEMTWAQCFEAEREQSKREGFQQGFEKGFEKGVQRGEAKVLRKLLTQRLGSLSGDIEARIDASSPEQIEVWADRLYQADSLNEIFRI